MEALTELCDLVAQNPTLFADKLSWICSRCPPPSVPRLTRSHLNSLLALARFLSKSPHSTPASRSPLLDFLRSSAPLRPSLWPQPFSLAAASSFFSDLFRYLAAACASSSDFASELEPFFGQILLSAAQQYTSSSDAASAAILKVFLNAVAQNCPPVLPADVERLVSCLLGQIGAAEGATSSENSSSWDSKGKGKEEDEFRDVMDDGSSESAIKENGSATPRRSIADQMDNGSLMTTTTASQSQQQPGGGGAGRFEEEAAESSEKMEIVFRLVKQALERGGGNVKIGNLEQVRKVALSQIKSLPAFLKIRKRDLKEQGSQLKARINAKLACCQAAIDVQIKSLLSMDSDGKAAKDALRRTLALLLDAAEACIFSSWRKLRICEELFCTLLNGISQVTISRGGQLLRVLLIPLKPLVNYTCAQADTLGDNQGVMFEAVATLSCEIIEFGWSKDRALVDTFIMGLAACLHERNDYEEQDGKEKQAMPVQLNLIRLLTDLSVSVNKFEVVDMIFPLFIESLEEGDAAVPSLLHLRVWNPFTLAST